MLGVEPAHRPVALAFGTAVHRALEAFYENLQAHGTRPPVDQVQTAFVDRWAVEVRDSLPLLFDEGQDADRVWLVEHKTAARRFTPDRIQYDFQPTCYLLAARTLGLDNPAAAFQLLLKTKKPACETIPLNRDRKSEGEFIDTVMHALRGIATGAFPRNRGWGCADCQFKHRCGG